jgi:hypothetical protein
MRRPDKKAGQANKTGDVPIYCIYKDLVTGERIHAKESFIESLTHDSYIIQIPQLAKKRRNDLEKLLSIFDQSESIDETHHILNQISW